MWKEKEGIIEKDENGNPIWIDDITKQERGFDVVSVKKQIAELTEKSHSRKDVIDKFNSILDNSNLSIEVLSDFIKEANENKQKLEGLGKGGKDDKLAPLQEQIDTLKKTLEKKEEENRLLVEKQEDEKINSLFFENSYLKEKSDPNLCRDIFKKNFKYDNGVLTGYLDGKRILDDNGSVADFDYAIKVMIDSYPSKDKLLVGGLKGGIGSTNSTNNGNNLENKSWFELCKLRDETTDPILRQTIINKMKEKK